MDGKLQMKFYAVKSGREIGIYLSWEECKKLVLGFPKAEYKSFSSRKEAKEYLSLLSDDKESCYKEEERINIPTTTKIYTDGSFKSKRAGYGVRILHVNGEIKEDFGKLPYGPNGEIPTNQRAELYAIKKALEITQGDVTIYSDSKYSIHCITKWVIEWKKNGWKTSKGDSVLNQDLIKEIVFLSESRSISYEHVFSHTGIFDNERVDKLADQGRLLNEE